jgi:uroporphyrinogen-III decarboxylase
MNLSPEFYEEFAMPYDAKLLEHFGGGAMHFCGRGDHYIELLCSQPKLYSVNLSQPHLNDMEKIYRNTVDKGVKLLSFNRHRAELDKNRPGGFSGNMHC